MANNTDGSQNHATVGATAPATAQTQWIMPRQLRVERAGDISSPVVARYPQVRAGVCEFCGIMDPNQPGDKQYKLCPHYRGQALRCSYCPESKDPDDVVAHSVLNIAGSPTDPNALVVWCDSFNCSRAHEQRFKVNARN